MKAAFVAILAATALRCAGADDISFNRTASFTNLQGQLYSGVQLVRADQDGLIWRDGASGGRICYTNLHPDLLLSLGIPTNRIETARARAAQKAIADARYRAQPAFKPAAPFKQSSETNGTDVAAPWLDTQYAASSPDQAPAYSSGPIYNGFPYMYPLDSAQSAPRAASAPGANPASSSIDVPRAPVTPSSGSTPSVPPARGMGHAVSAPSAPPASGPHRR